MMRPAVFLDRDGTMLEDVGYLTPSAQLVVYPWTIDAIRLVRRAGFAVVVVTNQGGVGRGLYTAEFVDRTHEELARRCADAGAAVDGWYYCPHHPEAVVQQYRVACACRKPAAGLVHAAARDLDLDLARSFVIGDQWRDVQLAHATGGRGMLVRTGHGRAQEAAWPPDIAPPAAICDNLMAAVAWILINGMDSLRSLRRG